MEFVMIVEPDEVGRKRLEAVFQTEKPSFSYQITGRPEEALDILEHQKTDVLVCETSLSVLSGREFFTMAKMISPDTVRVAMTSAEHVKDILSFLNECDIYKLIMKPCASFADFIEPVNAALEYHRLKKQAESEKHAGRFWVNMLFRLPWRRDLKSFLWYVSVVTIRRISIKMDRSFTPERIRNVTKILWI